MTDDIPLAELLPSGRPKPRFENGNFIPSVPIPDSRQAEDYSLFDILASIIKITRNPVESMGRSGYERGVTQFTFFKHTFTYINSPEAIKHCFIDNRENYHFQKIRQRLLETIAREGLLTVEGPDWQHARRAISSMFTPRNVKSFAQTIRETTERVMDDLFGHSDPILTANIFSQLTYLVLSDTLFSGDIQADQAQVLEDVATTLETMGRPHLLDMLGAPDWLPRITNKAGQNALNNIREMIARVIEKRQAKKTNGNPLPDDFLTRLLSVGDDGQTHPFTDAQIEDHIISFIGAGHETTARALCWLVYLLSQDTKRRARLEAEIDALDIDGLPCENWADHLPYTLACFEETMRLFPPAPFISREAITDDTVDGYAVAADEVVMINTWQLHRHTQYWDNPSAFIPERFLPENRGKIGRFQYLPFGVGERVCIGQRFALQEAGILIALLLRRYRFDYAGDAPPWPKLRLTVQTDNDMPMRVSRRR